MAESKPVLVLRSLQQTCLLSPSQWEGETVDGRPVYIRYRHGELTVQLGPVGGSIGDAIDNPPVFDEDCGEKHGCMLDWHEVEAFTGLSMAS